MSDDYLWDGSGEPDPEIEKLERLLGQYRYQPKRLDIPVRPRRFFERRLAVAAAIILMVLAGLWMAGIVDKNKGQIDQPVALAPPGDNEAPPAPAPAHPPVVVSNPDKAASQLQAANVRRPRKAVAEPAVEPFDLVNEQTVEETSFPDEISIVAMSVPAEDDLLDTETARHIEKAQLLLRAFRNATSRGNARAFDVAYEKEMSRELVYKNIVLRRDAEVRNNYPVEEVLASLEPLLLDIANLPASPSRNEMRSIADRIDKTEIVATLQVHSGLLAIQNQ